MFKCIHCDYVANTDAKMQRHNNRKIPCSKSMKQEREKRKYVADNSESNNRERRMSTSSQESDDESDGYDSINQINPLPNIEALFINDQEYLDYSDAPEGIEKCTWELDLYRDLLKCAIYNLDMYHKKYFREAENIEEQFTRLNEFQRILIPLRCVGDTQFWRKINQEAKKHGVNLNDGS